MRPGIRSPVLDAGPLEHPVIGFLTIQSPPPFTGSTLRRRSRDLHPDRAPETDRAQVRRCVGVFVLPAVGSASKNDSVWATVRPGPKGRHPANSVAGKKQEIHAWVAHPLDTAKLSNIPILVVPDADERLAFQPAVWRKHVAVRTIRNIVTMLFQPIRQREFEAEGIRQNRKSADR